MSNEANAAILIDLPRYGRPLPLALSAVDTTKERLLAAKQAIVTDVYAESIGNPNALTVPTIDTVISPLIQPQLDGNYESKQAGMLSEYERDSLQVTRGARHGQLQLSGPLILSLPDPGSAENVHEEAFKEFGVEFLARMLENPKHLFEMMKYVDQEQHGVLKTEDLVQLIYKIAE